MNLPDAEHVCPTACHALRLHCYARHGTHDSLLRSSPCTVDVTGTTAPYTPHYTVLSPVMSNLAVCYSVYGEQCTALAGITLLTTTSHRGNTCYRSANPRPTLRSASSVKRELQCSL